jgi:hypothetical protein
MTETCDCSLCRLEKEIVSLREENAKLLANAIVWHKWPEEKPDDYESRNLVYWDNKDDLPCEANPPGYWFEEDSFHWAEIPKPEGE